MLKPASIIIRVWLDSNADGIQDADENGIAGITVRLLDGSGNQLNVGSVQFRDGAHGDVVEQIDISDVTVSVSGDNTDVAVDSVVVE